MRHSKNFNHLGRKVGHRRAMLANMASSLILHKRITTTTAKAKALRVYVEPLITKSKSDSTHSRRVVFSYLQNKDAVTELFREVSPKVINRPGGYTRILKTGTRVGDAAEMCVIELVDYNENLLAAQDSGKAKSGRRRRSRGKKTQVEASAQTTTATEVEDAKEEIVSEEVKETPEVEEKTKEVTTKSDEIKEEPVKEVDEPTNETDSPEKSDETKTDSEEKKEE